MNIMNIDDNHKYVALGDNGTTAIPLRVEPISGDLMVEIHKLTGNEKHTVGSIDENDNSTAIVSDGANPKPLLCDSNGYLIIDLN